MTMHAKTDIASNNNILPQKKLWQAVVMKALMDATAINPYSRENVMAHDEADSWLRHGGHDFAMVCSLAGWDPEFIRDSYTNGKVDGFRLRKFDAIAAQ